MKPSRLDKGEATTSQRREEFLRIAAFDTLCYFVAAATAFFGFIIVLLFFVAPPDVLPILVVQKGLYAALLLAIFRHLRSGRWSHAQFNSVLTAFLALCLTSGLFTAYCGLPAHVSAYSVILLLGCALVEVSYRWAAFHWAMIWIYWSGTVLAFPHTSARQDLVSLVGVQLVALAALTLRLRLYQMQFETLQRLEAALRESEEVRASLDLEVDRRTEQLQAAYQELRLSLQERERIAGESEKIHEQLLQSQKMDSLGRLAGGVAHDFNNLLTIISGNLELARMQPITAEVEEMLSGSCVAAMRAADLTGQLLAFSRKQVMKTQAFELRSCLTGAIKLAQRLLGEDVRLKVSLGSVDAVIEGDPSQIEQALMNLVVNARDAMPQGGELEISLVVSESEVQLRVRDSGCGITPEVQERMFEPFFTSKPMGRGTGLGLSTVHGIVSRHNGKVSAVSAPGEGACFTISLPLTSSAPDDTVVSQLLMAPLAGSGRVMLVEDDDQVRNLAMKALRLAGYEVTAFEDGKSALASLEQSSAYDLLLTDVVMPGLDGGKLAELIHQALPDLPVLFMSGYTDDRLSSFGLMREQNCGFLAKPFTPLALQKAVADAMRAHRPQVADTVAVRQSQLPPRP